MTDIEKLQEIIDEIDVLIEHQVQRGDSEFQQWHNKAKRFLFTQYGETSLEYKDFLRMDFMSLSLNPKLPDHKSIEECRKDLITVKGIFNNYLRDLRDRPSDLPSIAEDKHESICRILTHFRNVAVQLSRRHDGRETLRIQHCCLCTMTISARRNRRRPMQAARCGVTF